MNTYNLTGNWYIALTKKLQDMRKSYKEAGMLVKTIVMEDITELEKILEDAKRRNEEINSEISAQVKSIKAPPIIKKKKNLRPTKRAIGKRKSARKESSGASIEEIESSNENNVTRTSTSSNKTPKKTKKKQDDSDDDYSPMDDFDLSVPVLPVTRGRGRGRSSRGGRGRGRGTKKKTIQLWLPTCPYKRAAILRANPHLLQ